MGGEGSGGKRNGAGKKRSQIVIEKGMVISLSRVSNDGAEVATAVEAEVVHVGGVGGHEQQFMLVTADETLTLFVSTKRNGRARPRKKKMR